MRSVRSVDAVHVRAQAMSAEADAEKLRDLRRIVHLVKVCADHEDEGAMPLAEWNLRELVGPHYAALFVRKCVELRDLESTLEIYLK